MSAKITYKTSEEHTKKLMWDFFKRTSIPRIIAEQNKIKKQEKDNQAI